MLFPVALLALLSNVLAQGNVALSENLQNAAGGDLSQELIQSKLTLEGVMEFELFTFVTNMGTAFFEEAVEKSGDWPNKEKNGVKPADEIKRIYAEQKAMTASFRETLVNNKAKLTESCKYNFPLKDEKAFMSLASIITNLGMGAMINLENRLARTDPEVIPHISKMIPVKARHDAFFRTYLDEEVNPSAFATSIPLEWAYDLVLDFVEPGSCQDPPEFFKKLKVFPDLKLHAHGEASPATPNSPGSVTLKVDYNLMGPNSKYMEFWMAWTNQDKDVIYTSAVHDGDKLVADVPAGLFGIVYGVLTNQNRVRKALDLVKHTLAGPVILPMGPKKA